MTSNGDLNAPDSAVERLGLKDQISLLRDVLAVLSQSATRTLTVIDANGKTVSLSPSDSLLAHRAAAPVPADAKIASRNFMPGQVRKGDQDDVFDPKEFLASTEQHESKISALDERTAKLESHLSTPQTRNLKTFLRKCSVALWTRTPTSKLRFKSASKESDRSSVRKTFDRFGGWVGGAAIVALGVVAKQPVKMDRKASSPRLMGDEN